MLKLLLFTFVASVYAIDNGFFLSDEFIESINRQQNGWIAGRNFPNDVSSDLLPKLPCAKLEDEEDMRHIPEATFEPHELDVPETFNAQEKWPNCKSITEIRDQDACGSCWAISAVQAMTDRYCIHSDQQKNHHFATMDPLTCCPECGDCSGGFTNKAFEFWTTTGIVSGGNLNTEEGCRPYYVIGDGTETPPCDKKCHRNHNVSYEVDKKFGTSFYQLKGEEQIKAEVYKNGPLAVSMVVYEDFHNYKKGVYKHIYGEYGSGHAMKLFGWGVEKGQKYWLLANSWGSGWGDNGFVKVLRGKDECTIESRRIAAGL